MSTGESQSICGLVRDIAGSSAQTAARVDCDVCEACARYRLPDGPQLNPVVAALLYSSTQQSGEAVPSEVGPQVANHQTRQFAMRWLPLSSAGQGPGRTEPDSENSSEFCSDNLAVARRCTGTASLSSIPADKPRIGLVGRNSPFGLGHQNRDIAAHLEIDRWLVPRGGHRDSPLAGLHCRVDFVSRDLNRLELEAWLRGLDVVLFVEAPCFPALPEVARRMGIRVVCIPNWEWLHAGLEWLDHVDLMLCPTRHTAQLLSEWKARFRFSWDVDFVPWPVDTERFQFRRRFVCRRFVFVNGSGGSRATSVEGSRVMFRRKGLAVLLAAAKLAPEISVVAYALAEDIGGLPSNVELRPLPADNSLLYCDGDVCVQPSHWEGLGLPLLECQAAGMPLLTTDAPPMNEYRSLGLIPSVARAAYLTADLCIPAAEIVPEELAAVLRSWHGRGIFLASGRARRFIEREHSWPVARPRLLQTISRLISAEDSPNVGTRTQSC
jgi:glycosyltransferase involved in cell wall biosynthesis